MINDFDTSKSDLSKITMKLLIYGSPGSGKTWFSQTMPSPYTVGFEDGLLYWKMRGKKCEGCTVDSYEDLIQVLDEIHAGKRANGNKTIVFDGLHLLSDAVQDSLLRFKGKKRATDLNQGDWGVAKDYVRIIMRKLTRDLAKYYHICVLGDATLTVSKDNIVYGLPDTIGRLRGSVGGYFDLYLYSEQVMDYSQKTGTGVPQYKLHSVRHNDFGAKDRSGTIVDEPIPNDFSVIFERFVKTVREHRGDDAITDNPYLLGEDVSKIAESYDSGENPQPTVRI